MAKEEKITKVAAPVKDVVAKTDKEQKSKETVTPVKGVVAKIAKLADLLRDAEWQKDGVNAAQKYKYISEAQYKRIHGQAVSQVGLLFKFTILDRQFIQNITTSMHLTTITVQMEYIDPETGEREIYMSYGDGADSGDKGLYKAQTGAYKYHISTNFHVAEYNDPEQDDPKETKKVGRFSSNGGFMSPAAQSEAKEKVLAGEVATKEDVASLTKVFKEYQKLFPERAAAFTKGNSDFSKIKAVAMKQILPNITEAVKKAKGE